MRSNTPLASGDLNGCWLSKLVLTAETAGAIHLDDEQIPGEMLQKLGVGAAKWFRGEGTAEEGATPYLQMNMIEKRAVQFAFPRSIFITFNGSEYRSLFPDRMPRHLDRPRCDAVGNDVRATAVPNSPASEAHPHAVGARPDGVLAVEEGRDLVVRKMIVLGARDHSDAGSRPKKETFETNLLALARLCQAKRETVSCNERAPLPAADAAAEVGRDAAEHRLDVEFHPRPPRREPSRR